MSYNYDGITLNEAKELLRTWREGNERKGEDVMEIWAAVLKDNVDKLGNEKHLILEQVVLAGMDCHQYKEVTNCFRILSKEFSASSRVMNYTSACLEAEGDYTQALQFLDMGIEADPADPAPRKRRIAVLKAQGLLAEAITELVDYLNKFMSDAEGWQELSALYLRAGSPARAAFCAEELLLHQPHHHLHHQRLADIRYTMGGVENLELAKTYYSQALKLNPDNLRALLGLFLTTNQLLGQYKSGGNSNKRAEVWKLCQWTQKQAGKKSSTDGALTQMMLNLAISE